MSPPPHLKIKLKNYTKDFEKNLKTPYKHFYFKLKLLKIINIIQKLEK